MAPTVTPITLQESTNVTATLVNLIRLQESTTATASLAASVLQMDISPILLFIHECASLALAGHLWILCIIASFLIPVGALVAFKRLWKQDVDLLDLIIGIPGMAVWLLLLFAEAYSEDAVGLGPLWAAMRADAALFTLCWFVVGIANVCMAVQWGMRWFGHRVQARDGGEKALEEKGEYV